MSPLLLSSFLFSPLRQAHRRLEEQPCKLVAQSTRRTHVMEEEDADKRGAVAAVDAEELVGPNEVVARALDGTRFYLYNHQAGGHTAFLRSGGGSVCKPVVALELQFYEALAPQFPQLRPFVPQFLGKVKVELTTSTPSESPTSPSSSQASSTPPTQPLVPGEPMTTPKKMRKGSFGKKRRLGRYSASNPMAPPTSEGGYSAKLWKQERAKKSKKNAKGDGPVALTRAESGNTKDYLVLGDLTRSFRRPCVLDIKMGTRQHGEDASPAKVISHTAKCAATTSLALGLRLCGMQIYDEHDGTYTIWDKTWGRQLKPEDIEPALETYLSSGSILRWGALEELLTKIRQLKSTMANTTGLRCWGSSLLLIYEGDQSYGPPNADVRLIDFAHCQMSPSLDTPDDGMLLGLSNIDRYLSNIVARKPIQEEAETMAPESPSAPKLQLVA